MKNVTIITDSVVLSQSIASYLEEVYGNEVDCFPMSYQEQSHRLTGRRYQKTDVFVLGLFRAYNDGLRAEALYAAEQIAKPWRKIVIVGEWTLAETIGSPIYWDMGSVHSFYRFFEASTSSLIQIRSELEQLRCFFHSHCFKPQHGRGSR